MRIAFEKPRIEDFGSIAEHTFTRCGGTGYTGPGTAPAAPPKDFPWVPNKLDNFGECSGTGIS